MVSITPELLPNLLVGITLCLLAISLMLLDPGSRVNRAFSMLLLIRSLGYILGTWSDLLPPDDPLRIAIYHYLSYGVLLMVPLVIYFLSVYPRPRGPFGSPRWGPWALLAATLAMLTWYAIDHTAFSQARLTSDGVTYTDGPLLVFRGLRLPIFAVAAFVLARDYSRNARGSQGYSTFLVAAAMTLTALFDGTVYTLRMVQGIQASGFIQWLGANTMTGIWYPLCLPLGLGALVHMGSAMRLEREDATLQEARRFMSVIVPIVLITGLYAGSLDNGLAANKLQWEFIRGFWLLVVPATITYALMRFSLFDIDIRLKAGVKRAIVLGAFAVTFFLVSEAAEATFGGDRGPLFGIGAAALLAAGARPLQVAAQKAADTLMPDTVPLHMLSPRQRETLYREQFLLVGSDGTVTSKERRMLEDLAEALRLDARQTRRLESSETLRGSTKAPIVPAGRCPRPGRSAVRGAVVATTTALAIGALSASLEYLLPVSDFMLGLLGAAAITVLLGPIDRFAMYLAGQQMPELDPAAIQLFNKEIDAALSDGHWSHRDRRYLGGLAEHLGIAPKRRRAMFRAALAAKGLGGRWRRAAAA